MRPLTDHLHTIIRGHPRAMGGFVLCAAILLLIPVCFVYAGRGKVYRETSHIPEAEYGIVFGAGVTEGGIPSTALRDRLATAIALYNEGTVLNILISGDNSESHHYETDVMGSYLIERGIPPDSIIIDDKGIRTYDTCRNAKETYNIDEALLITQGFHLPRALFLCNELGVESSGVSATQRDYLYENIYKLREVLAIYKSLMDIYLFTGS